jgi:hypothetical protein
MAHGGQQIGITHSFCSLAFYILDFLQIWRPTRVSRKMVNGAKGIDECSIGGVSLRRRDGR